MYVILFLTIQLMYGVDIGETIADTVPAKLRTIYPKINEDLALISQEPWKENFKDLFEDLNFFTENIATFKKDWSRLNEAMDKIKNQLIMENNIDFTTIWNNWSDAKVFTDQHYRNYNNDNTDKCISFKIEASDRWKIEDQYANLQKVLTKPLDMHKNYIVETTQSLNNQIAILKEILPIKLRNCDQILNCTNERTWVFEKLKISKMVLENIKDKAINTMEVFKNVSYNIYKQRYEIRKQLLKLKNKYICCVSGKITCMEIPTEMDTFEPLNFESLMPKVKYNIEARFPPKDIHDDEEENHENPSENND